ncbi:MAG TPA: MoaD/ThiS family protein [Thermoplasmata archaeon]|nr:MoaD/ThiS family protein [Thermoplasmata archaeon]HYB77190.1 MoaD/ThiS family protein [Thermoplasmata archaeon]
MPRQVTVLLFATARLATGRGEVGWTVPPEGVTLRSLLVALGERYPKLAPILSSSRFVLNGRYVARPATRVHPGDEFAVHPPYGGG